MPVQNRNSQYTWVIDPIDGTKNFILGLPTWSNLIGLYDKKNSILSFANFQIFPSITLLMTKNVFCMIKINQEEFIVIKKLIIKMLKL